MFKSGNQCPCVDPCPISSALRLIGGKWKIRIICSLNTDGTTRYNELKRKINDISNTMLATTLKELEEDGLIVRTQFMEIPPHVEYSITDACAELIPIIDSLGAWVYHLNENKKKD
ncbi:winged helix-turn-helix transcriptional regulator [Aminipila terrae]|uniref:Transcriptional regulator n=1 Tax=Aminipila terrae TaxID=2697030 RepID=A0A6P1MFV6_9FIRM|nr:helix-turn-helix domain-containing protein [Aminipila terrae]QHI72932.1 transcriptional regulator [Aminipila terrae]